MDNERAQNSKFTGFPNPPGTMNTTINTLNMQGLMISNYGLIKITGVKFPCFIPHTGFSNRFLDRNLCQIQG